MPVELEERSGGKDIERLAIVGEKNWEKGMATFCKPFTIAKVRFFEHDRKTEAQACIEGE